MASLVLMVLRIIVMMPELLHFYSTFIALSYIKIALLIYKNRYENPIVSSNKFPP